MKRFIVEMAVPVYVTIKVDAETEEEAEDAAYDFLELQNFAGNHSNGDKLVGTTHDNVSLYAPDDLEPLNFGCFRVTVNEEKE